jgi:hypothetical protein
MKYGGKYIFYVINIKTNVMYSSAPNFIPLFFLNIKLDFSYELNDGQLPKKTLKQRSLAPFAHETYKLASLSGT